MEAKTSSHLTCDSFVTIIVNLEEQDSFFIEKVRELSQFLLKLL